MKRKDLTSILHNLLLESGGKLSMIAIFKVFWDKYNGELKKSGDLFYTWNYDIRWAATDLRKKGIMKPAKKQENTYGENISSKGIWELF